MLLSCYMFFNTKFLTQFLSAVLHKLTMRLTAVFPFLKATMASQIIHLGWEATNVPESGLKDITFPMAMPNAPHEEGYYFEQAVHFENIPEGMDPNLVIYTGLQPRPDKNGKSIVHVAFSSFFPGTTSLDSNCYNTADGGPGVSCEKEVESSYDDIYHLRIRAYNETYYFGTLINHSSGQRWPMGSFNLPTGVSGMKGGDWVSSGAL